MTLTSAGLHHVTAIAVDPQANLDFHTGVLGLSLVKQTVNFDDPGTYHFYFGDRTGRPGTTLTFFAFPLAGSGRRGAGEADAVAFAAPTGSIEDWLVRLSAHGLDVEGPFERFGEPAIAFRDPDGLRIEIIAAGATENSSSELAGFHSVTLALADLEPTARLLAEIFGFADAGEEDGRLRLKAATPGLGTIIDLRRTDATSPPRLGGGSIHHIAFRARGDQEQTAWREALIEKGFNVTEIKDRHYFRSIYFREPGGVLFEIATDQPGFAVDEGPEALGRTLKLPPWFEARRQSIESKLPTIRAPGPRP